jgi:hypothetical protein
MVDNKSECVTFRRDHHFLAPTLDIDSSVSKELYWREMENIWREILSDVAGSFPPNLLVSRQKLVPSTTTTHHSSLNSSSSAFNSTQLNRPPNNGC